MELHIKQLSEHCASLTTPQAKDIGNESENDDRKDEEEQHIAMSHDGDDDINNNPDIDHQDILKRDEMELNIDGPEPLQKIPSLGAVSLSEKRNLPEQTPETMVTWNYHDLDQDMTTHNNHIDIEQQNEEFNALIDEKFKDYSTKIITEIHNMSETMRDMKKNGIAIEKQESEKQMKLVISGLMKGQYDELKQDLDKMMVGNRDLIKKIHDGNVKMVMDKYDNLNKEHNALSMEHREMKLKNVHEYNELQEKYQGLLSEMELKRVNERELENMQNETKLRVEELETMNERLNSELVEKKKEMDVMAESLRMEKERVMESEIVRNGFGDVKNVVNTGFESVYAGFEDVKGILGENKFTEKFGGIMDGFGEVKEMVNGQKMQIADGLGGVKEMVDGLKNDETVKNGLDEIKEVLKVIMAENKAKKEGDEKERNEMKEMLERLMNEKEENQVEEKKITGLLDKVLKENEMERQRNNEIGGKLKNIMELMVVQNKKMEEMKDVRGKDKEEMNGMVDDIKADFVEKDEINEMKVKLDGIQNLIQSGKNADLENHELMMSEMREKLQGLQLLVSNANDEYKRDYENLVQILNKNQVVINQELGQLITEKKEQKEHKEQELKQENAEKLGINDKLKGIYDLLQDENRKNVLREEQKVEETKDDGDDISVDLVGTYNEKTKEIKSKLDALQLIIENATNNDESNIKNNEKMVEMKEKLEGVQLMITNSNNEYKRDYENLVEILNKNQLQTNNGFINNLRTNKQMEEVLKEKENVILTLNEEIVRLKEENNKYKENEGLFEIELKELKEERDGYLKRYIYLKRLLIFLLIFGVFALIYYIKKKGLHLKLMDKLREIKMLKK